MLGRLLRRDRRLRIDPDQNIETPLADFQRRPPPQRNQFLKAIDERATSRFQHFYAQYYITEAAGRSENPGHPLHAVHEFVTSEPRPDFTRRRADQPARCPDYNPR